jgi:hypothetical protein
VYAAAMAHAAAPTAATLAARNARVAELTAISDSLFPGGAGAPGYGPMAEKRLELVNAITAVANFAAPTVAERNAMQKWATRLESSLMSARENVRLGDAQMNLRIGAHIDPILSGQLAELQAPGAVVNMPMGIAVPPGWAGATNNNPPRPVLPIGTLFYTMPAVANAIVYRFMTAAQTHLGHEMDVLRNAAPVLPGYAAHAPLSSGQWAIPAAGAAWPAAPLPAIGLPPGAGNQPLVVFDPAGAALPYRFG